MRKFITGAVYLFLAAAVLATPGAHVPRQSPEFALSPPGGSTVLLSNLRGRVVVMEFLFVRSAHCMRVAQMLNKLHGELGARGFEPVGVAFDPPNGATTGAEISAMSSYFKLTYPVAYASKDNVDNYLNRARNEVLNIPQIVVIDRSGAIRAASGGTDGDPTLENESALRSLLDRLLKEGAGPGPKIK